ncbi:hypothetical protein LOTGIDRAFT_179274 [Lottia gigantea]|uniref:Phosphomevalonate kinase n=1 Tax=Lottia gigantea TaxID=225164 RepID=V3Z9K9_LOTGI|nr:hypothetical protein LOTGIDRAFT_179274 [Lottia gigantea]ESO87613.1 hypothetical protein LOTGIDRAFT_179274 [Lottia gigantea]
MSSTPQVILVFSGKRKSGKDYVTDLLQKRFGENVCTIMRLSSPLKGQYAKDHDLDFEKLLDASEYKEKYRKDMIRWGEEQRQKDPGYFCRLATSGDNSDKPIWIISDARRKTDVEYFKTNYSQLTKTVRVEADEKVRQDRGFIFTTGVDDAESECGLDEGINWDYIINNNNDENLLNSTLKPLIQHVENQPKS